MCPLIDATDTHFLFEVNKQNPKGKGAGGDRQILVRTSIQGQYLKSVLKIKPLFKAIHSTIHEVAIKLP